MFYLELSNYVSLYDILATLVEHSQNEMSNIREYY